MLIYGSYLDCKANPPSLTTQVILADFLISFLAGMMQNFNRPQTGLKMMQSNVMVSAMQKQKPFLRSTTSI